MQTDKQAKTQYARNIVTFYSTVQFRLVYYMTYLDIYAQLPKPSPARDKHFDSWFMIFSFQNER